MNQILNISVTDTGSEPLTIQQAKDWMRVSTEDFDTEITALITVGRKRIEQYTQLSLVDKDVVLIAYLDKRIKLPSLDEIDTVYFWDGDDWEIKTSDDYDLFGEYFYPKIAGKWKIEYTTAANTNELLVHDLKRVVLWLFENRGDDTVEMPMELMKNAKTLKVLSWE